MMTGNPILDLILNSQSGVSRAAMNAIPPLGQVGPTPPFIPPSLGSLEAPQFMRLPEPAAPPIAPAQPLDQSIIERFRGMLGPAPAPYSEPKTGILQQLGAALQRGISAGLTNNPGEALLQLGQQDTLMRQRARERVEDRQDRYDATRRAFELQGYQEATRQRERTQDLETRRADQQFQRELSEWARKIGIDDERAMTLFRDSLQTQRDRERERAADEKLTQQQKLAFSKDLANQIKFYRSNGVKSSEQARRLALNDFGDFASQLGYEIPSLTAADNNALDLVNARIERLNRAGTGGAGGGAADKLVTLVEYTDAQGRTTTVDASKLKLDSLTGGYVLPKGATFQRIYTLGLNDEVPPGGNISITPDSLQVSIENEVKKGTAPAEIARKLRALPGYEANKAIIEGAIKARNLEAATTSVSERIGVSSTAANPEGAAFGIGGGTATADQVRNRLQLDSMKGEIDWLKAQRDYVQNLMKLPAGTVNRIEQENQLRDLNRRIQYADGEYKKAGGN